MKEKKIFFANFFLSFCELGESNKYQIEYYLPKCLQISEITLPNTIKYAGYLAFNGKIYLKIFYNCKYKCYLKLTNIKIVNLLNAETDF